MSEPTLPGTYIGLDIQVNKAQNAQKGLNPSRSKDAKGKLISTEKHRSHPFPSCFYFGG